MATLQAAMGHGYQCSQSVGRDGVGQTKLYRIISDQRYSVSCMYILYIYIYVCVCL